MVALALTVAAPVSAARYSGPSGIGVTLGDPFGITFKHWNRNATAWDLNVAFAYGPGFRVGADWMWTSGFSGRRAPFDLDVYAGVGPFVGVLSGPCWLGGFSCNGDGYVGARVPLGIEMLLRGAPFNLGLEVAPGLGLSRNNAGFLLDALLAARYVF